jgi:hypothetical protein
VLGFLSVGPEPDARVSVSCIPKTQLWLPLVLGLSKAPSLQAKSSPCRNAVAIPKHCSSVRGYGPTSLWKKIGVSFQPGGVLVDDHKLGVTGGEVEETRDGPGVEVNSEGTAVNCMVV